MASNNSLDHTITMHPFPHHSYPERTEASTPIPQVDGASKRAVSTSYEATTPNSHENDPIARHPITSSSSSDVEGQTPPNYTLENDPYQLSSRLRSESEINLIRANTSRKRDGCGPITFNGDAKKARKIQHFYESQNENIERWLKPVDEHIRQAREFEGENHLKFQIAVKGSFAANVILAILQVYAATSSGSLSLFTTMADAIFDPMSNVTLMMTNRAVRKVNPRRFPSGKARIETAGNIVFCFLMTAVSWVIIAFSISELAQGPPKDKYGKPKKTSDFYLTSVIVVGVAFCVKLALFCYCWALRKAYSQIHILWEDHRNDCIINGIGLLTAAGGAKLRWWIDPAGAIILSVLISVLWLRTAYKEFQLLIGVNATTQLQQWITYICEPFPPPLAAPSPIILQSKLCVLIPSPAMTHSPMITGIDTVRAYHSGPRIIVEVDVVMDPNESLRATHDVAEELQTKIESLPDVERAYVHIDYETSHKPEHFLKKEL